MGRRIIVGAAVAVALLAGVFVAVSNTTSPDQAPASAKAVKVAFYGDSYTLGTGTPDIRKRWSTIISERRGWDEFNPSVNGLGFINNRVKFGDGDLPDIIISEDPDIVFITMGLNDNFSYDRAAGEIHEQIDADFERLSKALPSARFIAVEPFWYTDERPESLGVISGWVKDAAADIGADYIPGASHWIEGHPEWMAGDGLHPNDLGYAEMARRMEVELQRLGL